MSIKAEVIIYDDENTDVQKKPYLLFPYDVKTDGNEEFMFEHFKFRFDYERMKRLKEIEHL